MITSPEQLQALMANLNPARVKTLQQKGGKSYLAVHDVKATLIRIFGFGGFSAECIDTTILATEPNVPNKSGNGTQFRVTAMCTVRLTIHLPERDIVYTESAVSSQSNPQPGEAADFAVKTAESDALKRAATYLGTQFGLSLYNNGATQDIVRVVLEPTQAAVFAELREQFQEQHADVQSRVLAATTPAMEVADEETLPEDTGEEPPSE